MSDGVHGGADDLGHSGGGGAPAPHAPTEKHGFRDYARVLRTHRNFRYLWIAETVDNVGSWLVSHMGGHGWQHVLGSPPPVDTERIVPAAPARTELRRHAGAGLRVQRRERAGAERRGAHPLPAVPAAGARLRRGGRQVWAAAHQGGPHDTSQAGQGRTMLKEPNLSQHPAHALCFCGAVATVCPTLLLARRVNRIRVLTAAALADAAVVALLALVRGPSQVGLLYALLTLQFSAAAFYDPGEGRGGGCRPALPGCCAALLDCPGLRSVLPACRCRPPQPARRWCRCWCRRGTCTWPPPSTRLRGPSRALWARR